MVCGGMQCQLGNSYFSQIKNGDENLTICLPPGSPFIVCFSLLCSSHLFLLLLLKFYIISKICYYRCIFYVHAHDVWEGNPRRSTNVEVRGKPAEVGSLLSSLPGSQGLNLALNPTCLHLLCLLICLLSPN